MNQSIKNSQARHIFLQGEVLKTNIGFLVALRLFRIFIWSFPSIIWAKKILTKIAVGL